MMTLSWRRAGESSALALALVVGLPALAQAQLFPNLFIQRERTPCPNEPPFYGHVRQNYYGYYPTCWRKFPEGWACPCPNPEAPDAAASFRERPRDARPAIPYSEEDFGQGRPTDRGPDEAAPDAGRRPADGADLPPLPRSVLGPMDRGNDANPPANTPGTRAPNGPGATQPTVPGRGTGPDLDPFEQPRGNLPLPRSEAPMRRPSGPEGPSLEPPQGVTSEAEAPSPNDAFGEPGQPVLALPEMPKPPGVRGGEPVVVTEMPATLAPDGTAVELPPLANEAPSPNQAPRRTGLIGGLMNMGGRRRR